MSKRLGFLLVILLVVPMLLTACSSDSPDTAEDYMNAVLKGNVEDAQALACDDAFAARTAEMSAAYLGRFEGMELKTIDLKYDIAKGLNDKEVLVSGALIYALPEMAAEEMEALGEELSSIEVEYEISNEENSLVTLILDKDGDDWCVTGESDFGKISLTIAAADDTEATTETEGETEGETEAE